MNILTITQEIVAQELAFNYLVKSGYKVLLKNYECPLGEIDLIAREGSTLVFIAVNRPLSDTFKKSAQYYIKRYGITTVPTRFDKVKVVLSKLSSPVITINKGGENEN